MNYNNTKKSFKIFLNTADTASFTGTKSNAVFPINLGQLGLTNDDLLKPYKMWVCFSSAPDNIFALSYSITIQYYLSVIFNNGSVQKNILNPSGNTSTIVLKANQLNNGGYTRGTVAQITGTIAPNQVTLSSATGFSTGSFFTVYGTGSQYGGTDFGGLTNGQVYNIASVASNTLTLSGAGLALTTVSGTMTAVNQNNYNQTNLESSADLNPPTYINNLVGISSVNLKVTTNTYTSFVNSSICYTCILYLEEI
jgi:hypothetical protein